MTSTSETGHAKIVAHFEKLLAVVTAFGADYSPSRSSIQLAALNAQLTAATAAIANINELEATHKHALAARDAAFKPISKLITRVSSALKASGTTPQDIEAALTLVRRLQGRRASRKLTDEEIKELEAQGETVSQASSSQMSFDKRLDNFDKLIRILSSDSAYSPNEEELKTTSLRALFTQLKAANLAVINAQIPLDAARTTRDNLLYQPGSGVVETSTDVKHYVKSVYGPSSRQYKSLSSLKFTAPKL